MFSTFPKHKFTKPPLTLHGVLQLLGQNLSDMQMTLSGGVPLSWEGRMSRPYGFGMSWTWMNEQPSPLIDG